MKKKFIKVTIDLPQELLYQLMLSAHEENLTLNDFVNKILDEYFSKISTKEKKIRKKQIQHGVYN